ncbi:hypothetical protein K3495_g11240 [Podosphaera aphanis]|nr:hypothetical protein K3495_g11240 [Podosphaera aphanis]
MVNEVKGKETDTLYEKSRLVIQAYNDEGKEIILSQSPTIQRASQRLIMALAPSMFQFKNFGLYFRDVKQAYTHSETMLNRLILAKLPREITNFYPSNTIMKINRPLYGITEAGAHWWATYSKYHREKLGINVSSYDPCLFFTNTSDHVGIIGLQTDDTLILCDETFNVKEEHEIIRAKFPAKPKEKLLEHNPIIFNGCILHLKNGNVILTQKGQGKKIQLVKLENNCNKNYIIQRARGAYHASLCQPEAWYDLSIAAQEQTPQKSEITSLNKRLQWQLDNLDRGPTYMPLNLLTA